MQSFRIKQLRVSGAGKIDGVIEFDDGLNIIQGRSNTGKTWILKCIYYLFSSDKNPFSPLTGYSDIEGVFYTKRYGDIMIKRRLNDNQAEVICEHPDVVNGIYETNYKGKGPLYLNDLWLRIIGLNETINVPKSARYARERISWTNIANVFFADEDEIDKSGSLIIKDFNYETALISSLYFLLTGDYKEGVEEILKPEVANEKKKAVVAYIEEQVSALSDKKVNYIMQLEKLADVDVDKQMQELTEGISTLQQEMSELVEDNTTVIRQISEYQQEDANCKVLIDRYKSLTSQYKADLQRLDFISKGEKAVKGLPKNDICPFCGGPIDNHDESYDSAIQAETKRIVSELAVIAATENNVREEQNVLNKNISELTKRRAEISEAIAEKTLKINDYRTDLQRYRDYTKLQSGIDFVNEQLQVLGQKKVSELQKKKNPPLYHAKKEFEELVGTGFNELLNKILKECNYRAGYASWDFKTFDILMDGVSKDHYDMSEHDPYQFGLRGDEPWRPISVFRTYESHIMQVRPWLPQAIGCLIHLAFGMADLSLYLPFYQGLETVPQHYGCGTDHCDRRSVYWKFRKLQTLVMTDYAGLAPMVKTAFAKFEADLAPRMALRWNFHL